MSAEPWYAPAVPVVHHIDCATLCPLSARLVNGTGGLFTRGRMVCHCLLVETRDGLVLVDTGLGTEDLVDPKGRLGAEFSFVVGPPRDPAGTALGQIRALGFDPKDVRHIVPTHLDPDHAGGLPDFPWASVHVHADEHAAAMTRPTRHDRQRYRSAHFRHGPRWAIHALEGDRWLGLVGIRVLADDVLLIPLAGHSRGHCGVAVRNGDGWLLHAGDAYFHHREMDEPPRCTPGLALFQRFVAVDDQQRRNTQQQLRAFKRAHPEVRVVSAHCPVELDAQRAASSAHRAA
jgi:glyoxylase-like metal-dependent hydrolase (beta-lactamase superfamily II)